MKFLNKINFTKSRFTKSRFVKSRFVASVILATTFLFSSNIFASKESIKAIYSSYEKTIQQKVDQLEHKKQQHEDALNDLKQLIEKKAQIQETIKHKYSSMNIYAKKGYIPNLGKRLKEIEQLKTQVVKTENLIEGKCNEISPENPAVAISLIPENYFVLEDATKKMIDEFDSSLKIQPQINQLNLDLLTMQTACTLASSIEPDEADEQEVASKETPIDLNISSKTHTSFGALQLAEMLVNSSFETAENQQIIKTLIENEKLFEQTEKLLEILKFTINNYLIYYHSLAISRQNIPQVSQQINTIKQSNYNKLKYYFASPAWNATKQTAIQTLLFGIPLAWWFSENPGELLTLTPYISAATDYKVWAATALSQLTVGIASKLKNFYLRNGIPAASMFAVPAIIGKQNISNFAVTAAPVRGFCSFLSKIKQNWSNKNQAFADINPIVGNTKLLINGLEGMQKLTEQNKLLQPIVNDIKLLFDKKDSPSNELSNLLELSQIQSRDEKLTTLTFTTMLQALVNMPNPNNKAAFINALKSVGKIDALMTLAKLQKEQAS